MSQPTDNDGFALECVHCRYRAPLDAPVSFLAAHFDVEHDTTDVKVELTVICPRCDRRMAYERTEGSRDYFACTPCHRSRVVTRKPEATP